VWRTQASAGARNSLNPIADLLGRIKMAPLHPDRQLISLAMGDPTACRNLGPPPAAVAALQEALASGNFNGYGPSQGDVAARAAVAKYVKKDGHKICSVNQFLTLNSKFCKIRFHEFLRERSANEEIFQPLLSPINKALQHMKHRREIFYKKYNSVKEHSQ
jgi:hypothetical protein